MSRSCQGKLAPLFQGFILVSSHETRRTTLRHLILPSPPATLRSRCRQVRRWGSLLDVLLLLLVEHGVPLAVSSLREEQSQGGLGMGAGIQREGRHVQQSQGGLGMGAGACDDALSILNAMMIKR